MVWALRLGSNNFGDMRGGSKKRAGFGPLSNLFCVKDQKDATRSKLEPRWSGERVSTKSPMQTAKGRSPDSQKGGTRHGRSGET